MKLSADSSVDDEVLYLTSGSVHASGRVTAEGFVVFAGATVNEKTSAKSLSVGMQKLRQKLFEARKVDKLVTAEDKSQNHSSIGVTMNTYTHLGLEDAQNEMIRLEELNRAKEEVAKAAGEKKPVTQRSFRAV